MGYVFVALLGVVIGMLIAVTGVKKQIKKLTTELYVEACVIIEMLIKAGKSRAAWKDYAIAIETLLDVAVDMLAQTDEEVDQLQVQRDNARAAVVKAAWYLYDLGEYPDIYESCPFLDLPE